MDGGESKTRGNETIPDKSKTEKAEKCGGKKNGCGEGNTEENMNENKDGKINETEGEAKAKKWDVGREQ